MRDFVRPDLPAHLLKELVPLAVRQFAETIAAALAE